MNLKNIAERIMLVGIKESDILEHYDYRKGKTFSDVKTAAQKGRREGNGKFEREVEWIAYRLGQVVKAKKKVIS